MVAMLNNFYYTLPYLWIFKIYFDSRQRKNQSSVESDLSSGYRSIELFAIFEPFESVDVCAVVHGEKAKEMNSLTKNHIGWNFHSVNHKWFAGWKEKYFFQSQILKLKNNGIYTRDIESSVIKVSHFSSSLNKQNQKTLNTGWFVVVAKILLDWEN